MKRKVHVEEANIKTASVTIQHVTINAKKMTLSVFRQIMKESIFNDDLSLKGIPWGQVNYFWSENEGYVHVLWQKGSELKRCPLSKVEKDKEHPLHQWSRDGFDPINLLREKGRQIQTAKKVRQPGWDTRRSEPEKWSPELAQVIEDLDGMIDKYNEKIEELLMLDHLFIAV